jgi:hypothetical protein
MVSSLLFRSALLKFGFHYVFANSTLSIIGHPETLPNLSNTISSRRDPDFVDRGMIPNQINHTYVVLGSAEFSPIVREALIENVSAGQGPDKTRIIQKGTSQHVNLRRVIYDI